ALAAARRTDHAAELAGLAAADEELAVYVRLLALCLGRYPELLRGELAATELLFPRSGMSLVEGIYKGNALSDVYNGLVNAAVVGYVERRVAGLADGEKIRILEVGAGT